MNTTPCLALSTALFRWNTIKMNQPVLHCSCVYATLSHVHTCVYCVIWPFCKPWFSFKAQIVGSKKPFSSFNNVVLGVSIDCMTDCDKEILLFLYFFCVALSIVFISSAVFVEWIEFFGRHRIVYSIFSIKMACPMGFWIRTVLFSMWMLI